MFHQSAFKIDLNKITILVSILHDTKGKQITGKIIKQIIDNTNRSG